MHAFAYLYVKSLSVCVTLYVFLLICECLCIWLQMFTNVCICMFAFLLSVETVRVQSLHTYIYARTALLTHTHLATRAAPGASGVISQPLFLNRISHCVCGVTYAIEGWTS